MGPRAKRRRLTDPEDLSDEICQPASRLEKDSWNGFCEIESEPVCLLDNDINTWAVLCLRNLGLV